MLGYLNGISFMGYDFQSYPNSQKVSLNILTYPYISYHIPTYSKISSGTNSQMSIYINSAMSLEGLDAYAINCFIDSRDAAYVQKAPEYDSSNDTDANPTEADSNDQHSEAQKFGGQSDGHSDSDQHTPAQKPKLQRYSPVSHSRRCRRAI